LNDALQIVERTGERWFAAEVHRARGEILLKRDTENTVPAEKAYLAAIAVSKEQKAKSKTSEVKEIRYYTPAVTIVAILVFLVPPLLFHGDWSQWLYRACVLLIIACPCALVISTPVSIVAGLTALAKQGVLVKGGAHLESLATFCGRSAVRDCRKAAIRFSAPRRQGNSSPTFTPLPSHGTALAVAKLGQQPRSTHATCR